jgi:hypothetical protein
LSAFGESTALAENIPRIRCSYFYKFQPWNISASIRVICGQSFFSFFWTKQEASNTVKIMASMAPHRAAEQSF